MPHAVSLKPHTCLGAWLTALALVGGEEAHGDDLHHTLGVCQDSPSSALGLPWKDRVYALVQEEGILSFGGGEH